MARIIGALCLLAPTVAFVPASLRGNTFARRAPRAAGRLTMMAAEPSKKILVVGGDGFCGWPTALHLSDAGHEVTILDNLSRRKIDLDLGCGASSLPPLSSSRLHPHRGAPVRPRPSSLSHTHTHTREHDPRGGARDPSAARPHARARAARRVRRSCDRSRGGGGASGRVGGGGASAPSPHLGVPQLERGVAATVRPAAWRYHSLSGSHPGLDS